MTTTTTQTPPDAATLDYSDVEEICGWQLLLCKLYEQAGGFDYDHKRTPRIVELREQARIWLCHVRPLIDSRLNRIGDNVDNVDNVENAIPRLLSSYDLLYRICNGAPDFDYIRKARLRLADKWAKGDKSISATEVVLELLKEVNRDNVTLDRRYSMFAISTKGKWIRQFQRFQCPPIPNPSISKSTNSQSTNQPINQFYSRLACIIRDDLSVYLGTRDQHRYKREWINAYTLSDEEIDGLDTPALRSYIVFARSAAYYQRLPLDDIDAQYVRLLTKFSLRPDLHPYCRAALEMDLAKIPVYAG